MGADPVVDALAAKLHEARMVTVYAAARAILADADLRRAIAGWQPPLSPAERLARVQWPTWPRGDRSNVAAAQRAIDAGWTPPEDDR